MALLPADRIQTRIHQGYGKAAAKLGRPVDIYRPTDPLRPLRPLDLWGSTRAVFDADADFKFNNPARSNVALRYALVEGAAVQRGDYLVSEAATHFVADTPPLLPIACVLCNALVSLYRTESVSGFGSTVPPGTVSETVAVKDWPASVLLAGRGSGDDVPLPGDVSPPNFDVLLPVVPNAETPQAGWVVRDDAGRRFAVSALDANAAGWRLLARVLAAA